MPVNVEDCLAPEGGSDQPSVPATSLKFHESVEELRELRKNRNRDPDRVVQLFTSPMFGSVQNHLGRLTDSERCTVLEQVCLASLDTHDFDLADFCLDKLRKKFPSSRRVDHLIGLRKESAGSYGEALEFYKKLHEENPTDTFVPKREAAILRARGDITGAIDRLNQYLETFPADCEVWSELGELYTSRGEFSYAVHCYEEMLLSEPHNYLIHCQLGELHYALAVGGAVPPTTTTIEQLEWSRNYFSHCIKLNSDCVRGQLGLALVCARLATYRQTASSGTKLEHAQMADDVVNSVCFRLSNFPHCSSLTAALQKIVSNPAPIAATPVDKTPPVASKN